jgi:hypothetical protein
MLEECPEGGQIWTVQTAFDPGDHIQQQSQLTAYLRKTAELLCRRGRTDNNWVGTYRRLVIVSPGKAGIALALTDDWLQAFMTYARGLEPRPAGTNVELGFIAAPAAATAFYGDWDIHITSESCSSLAFQCSILHPDWGPSIHLIDERRLRPGAGGAPCINTMLREGFRVLWDKSVVLKFREIAGMSTSALSELEPKILEAIRKRIEEVAGAENPTGGA